MTPNNLETVRRYRVAAMLTLVSAFLLGLGFTAPAMVIYPGFGELAPVLKLFKPELGVPRRIAILPGIITLLKDGNIFIGALLLGFSVIFPLWKLGVLWKTYRAAMRGEECTDGTSLVSKLGKYSMLDVLVLAMVVILIKGLPGGTAVVIGWGMVVFGIGVILSLLIPMVELKNFE